ncbi:MULTISPECIES: cysteine--tRNA ligase [unclassified Sphingomonas]|jgi:cysteinyl-tRNA synthetase|uniref:cysteine--tRNA ligase n=1 Tax=unclassified Sphingomonas TaxID=196159 RepID=UPI00082A0CEF|nr:MULTISPECIES: cysteine--tRNA ligase [unclassified Sphingomonas]
MTDATPLRLYNSLTRRLETFEPVHPGEARVYSCGPTVYNYPHIGNMRAYVFADTLGRVLRYKGYKLTHIINITDVGHLTDDADAGEDKLEKAAAQRAQSIWDIAHHYTEAFWADVKALNITEPAQWTIATDYVPRMIEFAKSIADKHCYELPSGLYFDVSTVADYGRLARASTEEGESRIDPVDGKRNAADFAIWRKTPPGETRQMEWDSPWGKGAPGWHLECSVMSEETLGFPFDIHTGGIDHREIHHPNEIAQNQAFCCTNGLDDPRNSGAKIWMHNNFLVERSGKMSKSSGEFLRLQLLIDRGYHPLAYRLMCLQAHYRSELEFSWEGLGAALTRLKRMVMAVERLSQLWADFSSDEDVMPASLLSPLKSDVDRLDRLDLIICDDLNTAPALVLLEEFAGSVPAKVPQSVSYALFAVRQIDRILGLNILNLTRADLRIRPKAATITEAEIEAALARRKEARAAKDFATSDAIRDELTAAGVEVMDGDPLGWDWKLGE